MTASDGARLSAELTEVQRERYVRNTSVIGIGDQGQRRLLASSVLVIGAGGLGSAALPYLAAAGIGRIGIVDFTLAGGGPGPATEERVAAESVIRDAENAGLRLLSQETFLEYQYFLIFGLKK